MYIYLYIEREREREGEREKTRERGSARKPACTQGRPYLPPWRQPRGKGMVSLVNSHTHATSKR